MSEQRIVIGRGPDALRAAAVLATAGHAVTVLQGAATASGRSRATLPEGTGRLRVHPEGRALVEQVLGPLAAAPAPSRGVALRGAVRTLPLQPYDVPAMLPGGAVAFVRRFNLALDSLRSSKRYGELLAPYGLSASPATSSRSASRASFMAPVKLRTPRWSLEARARRSSTPRGSSRALEGRFTPEST